MNTTFEWKAEIKFVGTEADFNKFTTALKPYLEGKHIIIEIPEWKGLPEHLAGCTPFPVDVLLDEEFLKPILEKSVMLNLNNIRDIRGGMRSPHLHIGDKVALIDRTEFKAIVVRIAQELAVRRLEATQDYIEVMSRVNALGYNIPSR